MAGLDRPNIALLSDAFLEDVRRMEKKNLVVELLERLLQGKIKAQTRTNLVQVKLRNSTTVDWQFRESVRAKMRILIRQLLRKYKYPPEGCEEAIALVLAQAQALADDWTGR